jgi:hypothetical protein
VASDVSKERIAFIFKVTRAMEMSGTTRPVTQIFIPEDWFPPCSQLQYSFSSDDVVPMILKHHMPYRKRIKTMPNILKTIF